MNRREELATRILLGFLGGPTVQEGLPDTGTLADYAIRQADALLERLHPQEARELELDRLWAHGVHEGRYPREANALHAKKYADACAARGEPGWHGVEGVRRAAAVIQVFFKRPWQWMPELWGSDGQPVEPAA